MSLRLQAAPVRHVLFDTGEIDGFGWSCFTAAEGDGSGEPAARVARRDGPSWRTSTSGSSSTRPTARTRSRRPTACASPVAAGSSTAATAATPTTTRRPTIDLVVDRPDAVRVDGTEPGPVRARIVDRGRLHVARVRGRRRPLVQPAERGDACAATVRTTLELRAGERFLRVAHEIDNRARDHRLRAHFPLPGAGRRLRRRVRVRGRASRAHRRRRRARVRPADVPVAPLRRRVRRHDRARADPRRPARVRGRRRRPRARAHALARGRVTCPAPSRSCARTRPARPIRSTVRSCSGRNGPSTR